MSTSPYRIPAPPKIILPREPPRDLVCALGDDEPLRANVQTGVGVKTDVGRVVLVPSAPNAPAFDRRVRLALRSGGALRQGANLLAVARLVAYRRAAAGEEARGEDRVYDERPR